MHIITSSESDQHAEKALQALSDIAALPGLWDGLG